MAKRYFLHLIAFIAMPILVYYSQFPNGVWILSFAWSMRTQTVNRNGIFNKKETAKTCTFFFFFFFLIRKWN